MDVLVTMLLLPLVPVRRSGTRSECLLRAQAIARSSAFG
jgi:hypothetical protein